MCQPKQLFKNQQALTPEQDKALQVWREVELDMIPNKEDAADHTAS